MATTFTVNGVPYSLIGSRAELHELHLDLRTYDVLDFSESPGPQGLVPTWKPGDIVEVTPDGEAVPRFKGEVVTAAPRFAAGDNWRIGYRAYGLKYVCSRIPVTSASGTGSITYNRPTTDALYLPAESNLTVGAMLKLVLDLHAADLAAAGCAGYVAADLDALRIVPPAACTFDGRLIDAAEGLLDRWQGQYVAFFRYEPGTSDWRLRILNPLEFAEATITFGPDAAADPVDPEAFELQWDASETYGRYVARGAADIGAAPLSTLDGTLRPVWTAGDQADWRWVDWIQPGGAYSKGTVVSLTSTSAVLDPTDNTETWTVGQWPAIQAHVHLVNTLAAGADFSEYRAVSDSTALTAGGTATVQWTGDRPLDVGGYTKYELIGKPSGRFWTYVAWYIVPDWVRDHLEVDFPDGMAWGNGTTREVVYHPVGAVDWTNTSSAAYYVALDQLASSPIVPLTLDRIRGWVIAPEPVVKAFNSQTDLDAGGSSVVPYVNFRVLLPYSKGPLEAVCPPDLPGYGTSGGYGGGGTPQYVGTGYDWFGIRRTKTDDYDSFIRRGDLAQYEAVACMVLDTVKDVKVDGAFTWLGIWSAGLALDRRVSFKIPLSGGGYATHLDQLRCPLRSITIHWTGGDDGALHRTTATFNNEHRLATGTGVFIHPAFGADPRGGGGGFGGGFGGGAFGFAGGGAGFSPFGPPGIGPVGTTGMDLSGGAGLSSPGLAGMDLAQLPQTPSFDLADFPGFGPGMPTRGRVGGADPGAAGRATAREQGMARNFIADAASGGAIPNPIAGEPDIRPEDFGLGAGG